MAPVGRPVPTGKGPLSKDDKRLKNGKGEEVKEEPPDERNFHEEVHIKIELDDSDEPTTLTPPSGDGHLVIKREESDEEEEKPDVHILAEVNGKPDRDDIGEKGNGRILIDPVDDSRKSLKSLLCKVCGKQFFRAFYFNLHIKTHQIPAPIVQSTDKPHKCQECGKSFALLQHLTGHSRIHIAGKYYECPVCRRKFTELSNLTMHLLKTHPDEKPYKCSECDKQFTQSSALKKHLRTHTRSTSQEDLDRIDMLFFVSDVRDRDIEEPLKKKIKLEKEDSVSPTKEKLTQLKENPFISRQETSLISKEKSTSVKLKSPASKEKSRSVKVDSLAAEEKSQLLKVNSPGKDDEESMSSGELHIDNDESQSDEESQATETSNSIQRSPPAMKQLSSGTLSNANDLVVHIKEEIPDEIPEDDLLSSHLPLDEPVFSPEKDNSRSSSDHELLPSTSEDCPEDKTSSRKHSKDTMPLRNGVPLDQVQIPTIKITKFSKTGQESNKLSSKGPLTSSKSVSGSNENNLEFQKSDEETENDTSSINFDKGNKSTFFLNKSNWFMARDKSKSERREAQPSLEKPDGDCETRYKCHRCDIFLDSEEILHKHLMEHSGVTLFGCRFCGKNFTTTTSLKQHLYYHVVGSIPQDCTRCGKTFATFRDLKDHSTGQKCDISGNRAQFKCFRCKRHMLSLEKLKFHLLSQCNDEPVKYYIPKKHDGIVSAATDKQLESDKSLTDSTCPEQTTRVNQWVSQKFEKLEKPGFLSQSDIEELNFEAEDIEALQIMCELEPAIKGKECWNLQCKGCGHKFDTAEKAKVHAKLGCDPMLEQKSDSGKEAEKENVKIKVVVEESQDLQCHLSCSECGKKVTGVEKMLLHIKEHINERNTLCCPVLKCGKLFKDPKDFKSHLKAHTGHKPYKCSDCGKRFFLRENYENHAQRHGVLKHWTSMTTLLGEKPKKFTVSARSPITIESSIINLEVSESDMDKKLKATSSISTQPNKSPAVKSKENRRGEKALSSAKKRKKVISSRDQPAPENQAKSCANKLMSPFNKPAVKRSVSASDRPTPRQMSPPRSPALSPEMSPATSPAISPGMSPPMSPPKPMPALSMPTPMPTPIPTPMPTSIPTSIPASMLFMSTSMPTRMPTPVHIHRSLPAAVIRPPFRTPTNIITRPTTLNRIGHTSGGSLSVTAQGVFTVGPPRSFTLSPTVSSKSGFAITSQWPKPGHSHKEAHGRVHPASYYRLSDSAKANIQAANAELRKYPRSGRCEVCRKICSRLDKHMMVHLNQKPHLCPFCPQAFRQSEHLRRHIRARHEGNHRQFECPNCYKRLTRKDKLKEHMRNCSITPENMYPGDSLFDMIPGPSEPPLQGHTTA